MSEELEKLKAKPKKDTGLRPGQRGYKKAYFLERVNLILELVESHGYSYKEIIDAIKLDGVELNYVVFKRWMSAEKKRRAVEGKKHTHSKPQKTISESNPVASKPNIAESPSNQAGTRTGKRDDYQAEIERIKALKVPSTERRKLLAEANEAYQKTINPLASE